MDPRCTLKWFCCINCKLSDLHDKLDYEQSLQQKGVAQLLQLGVAQLLQLGAAQTFQAAEG